MSDDDGIDLPDDAEARLERVDELLSENNYRDMKSALAQLAGASQASGDHDEIRSKLMQWRDRQAIGGGEPDADLEVVDSNDAPDTGAGAAAPALTDDSALRPDDVELGEDRDDEAVTRTEYVREITRHERQLFFLLAEQLWHIRQNDLHIRVTNPDTGKPYQSFKRYVKRETAHSPRTAAYLIDIWDWYVVEHSREFLASIEDVGWSILKELTGELTPDNRDEWLDYLETHSLRDVQERLKGDDGGGEEGDADGGETDGSGDEPGEADGPDTAQGRDQSVEFELLPDEVATVEAAVQTAQEAADTDSRGKALVTMCSEYLATHGAADGESSLKLTLARIEEAIGLDLVAIDLQAGTTKYGQEALTELARKKGGGSGGGADASGGDEGGEA